MNKYKSILRTQNTPSEHGEQHLWEQKCKHSILPSVSLLECLYYSNSLMIWSKWVSGQGICSLLTRGKIVLDYLNPVRPALAEFPSKQVWKLKTNVSRYSFKCYLCSLIRLSCSFKDLLLSLKQTKTYKVLVLTTCSYLAHWGSFNQLV